jgi:hypothetical protein
MGGAVLICTNLNKKSVNSLCGKLRRTEICRYPKYDMKDGMQDTKQTAGCSCVSEYSFVVPVKILPLMTNCTVLVVFNHKRKYK